MSPDVFKKVTPSTSEKSLILTQRLKEFAHSFNPWEDMGADLVGILAPESLDSVPRFWVEWLDGYTKKTSDVMEDSKSLIVLGYHASDDVYELIYRKKDRFEALAYMGMEVNVRKVVRFLEKQGFNAQVADDFLPKKQMARLAGLGSYGKNSLIINPKYGPWIRLQAIITDAELVPDDPFEKDLCGNCEACVKACPVRALSPYKIDPAKCLINPHDHEWIGLIKGDLKFSEIREGSSDLDRIFEEHTPKLTENSRLMCMTCQKACPYGREERGL
jgi:epoxyqueuosine reductase